MVQRYDLEEALGTFPVRCCQSDKRDFCGNESTNWRRSTTVTAKFQNRNVQKYVVKPTSMFMNSAFPDFFEATDT